MIPSLIAEIGGNSINFGTLSGTLPRQQPEAGVVLHRFTGITPFEAEAHERLFAISRIAPRF